MDLVKRLTLYFLLCTMIPFALLGVFVYKQAGTQMVEYFVVIGVVLAVANVGLYLATRRIMAPLNQLTTAARQVADGQFDARVPSLPRGGQVSDLVSTFNTMLDDLQQVRLREEEHAQETERTNQQLATLLETVRAISSELDLDRLLQKILEQAIAVIPDAEQGNIVMAADHGFRERVTAGFDPDNLQKFGFHAPPVSEWSPELGPMAQALSAGKLFCMATEAGADRQVFPEVARRQLAQVGLVQVQTLLIAPILLQNKLAGFVLLFNSRTPDAFDGDAQRMAILLAAQAAAAISNAQLYEQAQEGRDRFRLLYEASQDVSSSLDLGDVLRSTLERACTATGAQHGGVFIVDEAGDLLRHVTIHHDYQGETLSQSLLPRVFPQGLAGWVVREKQPALVTDTSEDPRWVTLGDDNAETLRSALIVPLLHQGQVVGGLSILGAQLGQFRRRHLDLMSGLAAQAATAIANARLFSKTIAARRDWETTFDSIADGIVIVDAGGNVVQVNRAFSGWLGYDPRELVGKYLPPLIFSGAPPDNCPTLRTLSSGQEAQGELSGDGLTIEGTFYISAYPRRTADGNLTGVVSVWRDVTAERKVQARARWLEELNQRIVENAGDIIYAHDLEGNFIFINPRSEEVLGYTLEEAAELNIANLVVPEQLESELKGIHAPKGTVVPPHEVMVITKSGERIPLEVSASPLLEDGWVVGVAGVARDLREIRRLEQRLLQAEKLSSLGQLIAGVAHELNNPLTAVIGYAQLLQDADVDEQTRKILQRVNVQASRAAEIVRNLLAFARQQEPHREPLSINEVIEETFKLVAYEWKTQNIETELDLGIHLPWIVADRRQLQQVFLNLFQNAEQAMMAAHDRGRVVVRTTVVDRPETRNRPGGAYLQVQVQDNGPGMSPETLSHIFDPFFTTKEVGQGTGLGLSICYGIVQEQEGRIWAESKPGEGSTFYLEWPIRRKPAATQPVIAEPAPSAYRTERRLPADILLVEDEEMLTDLVALTLREHGYRVEVAREGREALGRLDVQHFDLIISDIKMPGMDGEAFYRELQAQHPNLTERILFVTGDTVSASTAAFLEETGVPVLEKPFLMVELIEMLRRL